MIMKQKHKQPLDIASDKTALRRRIAETLASFGMILIAVGMFLPLINMLSVEQLPVFKWIFAAGALMFWGARCVNVSPEGESMRLRRLRRMEFWSGACFGVAAFFWFYNENKYGDIPTVGPLTLLNETILFALAGAVLQLVTAWMIYFRQKKERRQASQDKG